MKKLVMICFSLTGYATGQRLQKKLTEAGYQAGLFSKSRYLEDSIPMTTGEWAQKWFGSCDGMIFISSCGIALRSIAPLVTSKKTDPAVIVVDECGKFAISLLSGHLGGANRLTGEIAGMLGSIPVITTATDLHGRFAVDVFAKENGCGIYHMEAAKMLSAALLAGEKAGFYSEFPVEGRLPEGLEENTELDLGVAVTIHKNCLPFRHTVQVVPGTVTLGVGCKKDKPYEDIRQAVEKCLAGMDLYQDALEGIASIDLKKEEPGLLRLAKELDIPFKTWSGEELKALEGEFTSSGFVSQITGVDNVCERSAVMGSGRGRLIAKKTAEDGVTTAAAVRNWRIRFE